MLGPTYRLVGQGVNDSDIAARLNLKEPRVQCLHSLDIAFPRIHGPERTGKPRRRSDGELIMERNNFAWAVRMDRTERS